MNTFLKANVHGIVFTGISKADFLRLWVSEGGSSFYELEVVNTLPYDRNETISALTFAEKKPAKVSEYCITCPSFIRVHR